MKIDKNTANACGYENNTMHIVEELHTFYKHSMELHPKSHFKAFHFHQYFYFSLLFLHLQLFSNIT